MDVILIDIRMPVMDGVEATSRISADPTLSGVHILVLTTFETDELIMAALRAGAAGFIGKGIEPPALLDAICTVAAGESLLARTTATDVIRRALDGPTRRVRPTRQLADLTPREVEISHCPTAAGVPHAIGTPLLPLRGLVDQCRPIGSRRFTEPAGRAPRRPCDR